MINMKARLTRCSNQFGSCLFFVLLVSTTPAQATEPTQDASKGILDLRQANLDDATEIRLGGEWRVFWKQLVSEFLPNSPSAEYVAVPRLWNRPSNTQNFIRPEQGVTTLQLTVFLPESLPKSWHNGIHVNNGQVISASQLTIYDDATHEVLGRLKSGKVSADPNLHQLASFENPFSF